MSVHSEFRERLSSLPSGAAIYFGTVPGAKDLPPKPVLTFPYVLITPFIPRVGERGLSQSVHSRVARWRTTVTGQTADSVLVIAEQVQFALEGSRIQGQRLSLVPDDFPVWEDLDFTHPSTGKYLHYGVLEWRVTV